MNNGGGYQPFMFGGNYGAGGNTPQTNFSNLAGQSSRRDSYNVRDCMYWPASLGSAAAASQQQPGRSNYGSPAQSYGGGGGMNPMNMMNMLAPQMTAEQYLQQAQMAGAQDYVFHAGISPNDYGQGRGEPMQQLQQAPVKAYMSTPGEGGASGKPIQLPCHMGGGQGALPPVPNQPAVGYKVQVPQVPPTAPVDFEVGQ